jgi:hypothetical protein
VENGGAVPNDDEITPTVMVQVKINLSSPQLFHDLA